MPSELTIARARTAFSDNAEWEYDGQSVHSVVLPGIGRVEIENNGVKFQVEILWSAEALPEGIPSRFATLDDAKEETLKYLEGQGWAPKAQ